MAHNHLRNLLRSGNFEPILYAPLVWCGCYPAYREGIVLLLLLFVEHSADSLHCTVLKGAKSFDPSASRNGGVLPDSKGLLLSLLQNLLHGSLLRLVQVQAPG
jgi:hypothetical protein